MFIEYIYKDKMFPTKPIRKFEEISLNAWASLKTEIYDGWILRYSNGYTKRANSVIPIYSSTLSIDDKLEYCRNRYRANGLPLIFKLTELNSELDEKLSKSNFALLETSMVKTNDIHTIEPIARNIVLNTKLEHNWIEAYFQLADLSDKVKQSTAIEMLKRTTGTLITCMKTIDSSIVGVGLGIINMGFIGLFDIVVDNRYRRQGYGEEIVKGLLGAALKQNTNKVYLQVIEQNKAAVNLYNKMGFKDEYKYWYRKEKAIPGH
jgi:N-acetylglutamate synthase